MRRRRGGCVPRKKRKEERGRRRSIYVLSEKRQSHVTALGGVRKREVSTVVVGYLNMAAYDRRVLSFTCKLRLLRSCVLLVL